MFNFKAIVLGSALLLSSCGLFGAGGYLNAVDMPAELYRTTVDTISDESRFYVLVEEDEGDEELLEQINAFDLLFEENDEVRPDQALLLFAPVRDFYIEELENDLSLSEALFLDGNGVPRTDREIKMRSVTILQENINRYLLGNVGS